MKSVILKASLLIQNLRPEISQVASLGSLRAQRLVAQLLEDGSSNATPIQEASVHRSKRSRIWVACLTAAEGVQIWRSTGLTNYQAALTLAREWEAEEKERRAKLGGLPKRTGTRVRRARHEIPTGVGPFTQAETATILKISVRAVREIEHRALKKLRNHPALRDLWRDYTGALEEAPYALDTAEIQALFDLASTTQEVGLVQKIIAIIAA